MRSQIETKAEVDALFREASGGDQDAFVFLIAFDRYLEEIQELLVSPPNPTDFIRVLAKTATIYTLPFYVRNAHSLQLTAVEALQGLLEAHTTKAGEQWQVEWAHYSGLASAKVVTAVALLKIGFDKTSELRQTIRLVAWSTRKN